MMKKILTMILICAVILSVGIIVSADEITWDYNDKTKVLTIKGNGEMTEAEWNDVIDVTGVKKIVIENGITSICDNAFSLLTDDGAIVYENLQSVEIPESVTKIGVRAFAMAEKLTDVKLPSRLNKLGMTAFMNTGITDVTIPKTLTKWEKTAFSGCRNLVNVTIEEGVTKIPEFTFYNCASLDRIVLPESIVCIGESAFAECTNLEYIYIPYGVVTIGEYAIDFCNSLTEITIPASVKRLGSGALNNWYTTKLYFRGSKAQWNEIEKEGYTVNDVTEIVFYSDELNFTVKEAKGNTTLSWDNYPNATGYSLSIFDRKLGEYVGNYEFESSASFVMEDNGFEEGLYYADLWYYYPVTDVFTDPGMKSERIYFAVGESKGGDTYALTSVEAKDLFNGKIYVEAEIVERSSRNASDMFIIAVYNNGEMLDMTFVKGNLIAGVPFSFGGILEVCEGATLKAFVWDSIDGMKCLSNIVEK